MTPARDLVPARDDYPLLAAWAAETPSSIKRMAITLALDEIDMLRAELFRIHAEMARTEGP